MGARGSEPGPLRQRARAIPVPATTSLGRYRPPCRRSSRAGRPILEDREYGKHVLLAGDFNILAGAPRYGGHQVLEAIEGYGLVDCLNAKLPKTRYNDARRRKDMHDCQCGMGPECLHTKTFLRPRMPTRHTRTTTCSPPGN
jgi:hypothetical protein